MSDSDDATAGNAWRTPISPRDVSLNDLAILSTAASFAYECHAAEWHEFVLLKTGDDVSPERLLDAIMRSHSLWSDMFWEIRTGVQLRGGDQP